MKILAIGEIMLRLSPPGRERLFQSHSLVSTFGGSEANTLVTAAAFGAETEMFTALPEGPLGDACIRELRGYGIGTGRILRTGDRMGVYYLEPSEGLKPGKVIYDRAHSSMADLRKDEVDWETLLNGIDLMHISGITPAISPEALDLSKYAVRLAREKGIRVSCDLNYRKNLWKYGVSALEGMKEILPYTDILIANDEDLCMGVGVRIRPGSGTDGLREASSEILSRYPRMEYVSLSLLEESDGIPVLSACLAWKGGFISSRTYRIRETIDRVGAGDSFSGALLYALDALPDRAEALELATSACALKFSVPWDFNLITPAEAIALAKRTGDGNSLSR